MKLRISAWGTGEAPTTSGLEGSAGLAVSSPPHAATPKARATRGSASSRMRFLSGVREASRYAIAEELQELDEDDQDDHGRDRDRGLVALVAVADRHVAQATAAHGARHRGVAEDADGGDGHAGRERGERFGDEDLR